ncbi:MAG: FAD-binding protein [Lachnospiraceae bacterium]|nr:FAD-binding protein [Lachnospiraceae bacterium]
MKILENVELKKYTTFNVGGIAKKMYIPESVEELVEICNENSKLLRYVIGGGSNLLINDEHDYEGVLCLREFNQTIENMGDGKYYCGASVRLQKLINTVNDFGMGGIEYLYSVPGLVGGAIVMNAGRGRSYNKCISDYLVGVEVYDNNTRKIISKDDCDFQYRDSLFQHKEGLIVLGAIFQFEPMIKTESDVRKKERMDFVKKVQDLSCPNFGTVFCQANGHIMEVVKRLHIKKGGICWSPKKSNWLLNKNQGSYHDCISLIHFVQNIHRFMRKKCKVEVKIWE